MKTILFPAVVGACLLDYLAAFVTFAPGYEVAGQLLFIGAGAACGFLSGTISFLVARRIDGRRR